MAYNNNIPQPNDDLSVSQPQILANFAEIATAFNLNHVAFNATGEGKHMFVEMPNQNASPPTTIANEVGLYCNTSTLTAQPELFFIKQLGTTAPAPLNGANGYEFTSSNYILNGGWTRLPSGILMKWGTFSTGGSTGTVVFPTGATIPAFSNVYNIQLTANGVATQYYTFNTVLVTQFAVASNVTGINLNYLAIGI